MQDMWRGTVFSPMLQGVLHKGEIQLLDAGGWRLYIHQEDTTKKCTYVGISYIRI
jgi:hypothetical protein